MTQKTLFPPVAFAIELSVALLFFLVSFFTGFVANALLGTMHP